MIATTATSESNEQLTSKSRRRGCLFYVKRGLLTLVALLVAIPVLGIVYQSAAEASDQRSYPPLGQIVNVEGHEMHIYCTGEGSPTILLEAGAFSFSLQWYWVQQQLEPTNRVCSYDRAGNGWSEPGPAPRDAVQIAHELNVLLNEANVPGPYVLVGHSLGGVLVRVYAEQYPDEVLGLVLVDSAVPSTWPDMSDFEQWKSQNESAYALTFALMRVGAARFIINREFQGYGYPAAVSTELTAYKATAQGVNTWDAEFRLAQWGLGQQAQAAENLGALPMVDMWVTHPEVSPDYQDILREVWQKVGTFSSNSVTRIFDGASHGSIVGNEQYAQQVSIAVLDVIKAAQTGEPLSQ